jgi:hypothetical protein
LEFCRYKLPYAFRLSSNSYPTSIPGKAKFEVRKISHSYSGVISNFFIENSIRCSKTKCLETVIIPKLLLERNTLAVSIPKPVTPIFDVYDPFNSAAILF